MSQSGNSGVAAYAGIVVVMIIAVATLAMFKLNLGGINDMLFNDDTISRPTNPPDPYPHGDSEGTPPEVVKFTSMPPDRPEYATVRSTQLPKEITVTKKIGDYEVEIEMCLVPQGWFPMGENDGIAANGPKHWVWLDDYYVGKYEFTNAQYYGFILANGYRDGQYWTQEGYEYMRNSVRNRGTEYIGWTSLEGSRRIWALASPNNELVLEVQGEEGFGQSNTTVLILPQPSSYSDYLSYDPDAGNVYLKYGEDWKSVSGEDIRKSVDGGDQFRLKSRRHFHTSDTDGHIDLSNIPNAERYAVIAWVDGDDNAPTFGQIRRARAHRMRSADMPIVGVSWFEADACARFFDAELPTEAQWEKAGRGTKGSIYPWGEDLEMNREMATDMGRRQVTDRANLNRWSIDEVGSFPDGQSVYGVHDLVGNTAEWCRDVFVANPKWGERNPYNRGGAKERRSLRGTHTDEDDPQTARLHHRRDSDPYDRRVPYNRGFRIVMDPDTALKMARQ